MVKDMNRIKYKAILDFFNAAAVVIKEPTLARNFCDIYQSQLAAVIRNLKINDSFDITSYQEGDPYKMAKEIFEGGDFGINFLLQIDPIDTKNLDEIKIGKLLIGIIYLLKIYKPDLYKSALEQVDKSQNYDHEIEHIILYLETKEQWPVEGWPNILNTPAPLDFYDRVKPLPSFNSSSGILRTPARRSFRQQVMSPYKKTSNDSPIAKAKDKEYKKKIINYENQILHLQCHYNEMGQKYDELLEENKKFKDENQKLKNSIENAKLQLQDYHVLTAELKQIKTEKEELQKEIKLLKESNTDLTVDLKACYKSIETSNSDSNKLQHKIDMLQKTNASLIQQVADYRDELIEARNDRDLFQQQLQEKENTLHHISRDYELIKKQNSEMSRMSLNVTDVGNINLTDENQRLRDQITEMTKKYEDERDELNQAFVKNKSLLNAEIERLNLKLTDIVKESEKRKNLIETYKNDAIKKDSEILEYRSNIAELNGKFQCLKENAEEWKLKYEAEHAGLAKVEEDKQKLLKKKQALEGTVENQCNTITVFERKELGSLARKLFYENLSIKERMSISSEDELPWLNSSKPIFRSFPHTFNRSN
uniref:Uncharacterized protein n=1 Tax=Panagrolaimus sp. ES5 TaxID=591445 RepID=A0AC34FL10_9BILA